MQNRYQLSVEGETQPVDQMSDIEKARLYFDIEGWNVFNHFVFLLNAGKTTLADIEKAASNPTQKYFLILYNSPEEAAKRLPLAG